MFLYIVFGILIQIFVRKESGKKVIPNHDFWVAVPSYIKVRYTNHGDQYYNNRMHQKLVDRCIQKKIQPVKFSDKNLNAVKVDLDKHYTRGNHSILEVIAT